MDFMEIARDYHLWILGGIATLGSFIHALRKHGRIWRIITYETGSTKQEAISRLCLIWLAPILLALLTVACLLGAGGTGGGADLQKPAAAPGQRPYRERLTECLNKIDPGIIPALRTKSKNGKLQVYGYMNQALYEELQKLSKEPESAGYITITRSENSGQLLQQGKLGNPERAEKVSIVLDVALLDEQSKPSP